MLAEVADLGSLVVKSLVRLSGPETLHDCRLLIPVSLTAERTLTATDD